MGYTFKTSDYNPRYKCFIIHLGRTPQNFHNHLSSMINFSENVSGTELGQLIEHTQYTFLKNPSTEELKYLAKATTKLVLILTRH